MSAVFQKSFKIIFLLFLFLALVFILHCFPSGISHQGSFMVYKTAVSACRATSKCLCFNTDMVMSCFSENQQTGSILFIPWLNIERTHSPLPLNTNRFSSNFWKELQSYFRSGVSPPSLQSLCCRLSNHLSFFVIFLSSSCLPA